MSIPADQTPRQPASNDRVPALRLALIPGVGPIIRKRLLDVFGSAETVLNAAPSQLRVVTGIGPTLARSIVAAKDEIDAEAEIARCQQHGIEILTESDSGYPRLLREIPDPPGVLFVLGQLHPEDAMSIAIVGTRHATQYGLKQAHRLAHGLACAGLTIVSGLARGVDSSAHRGALEAGGRTLAVLASGVLNVYPPEHKQLARQITESGAVVSENAPLSRPLSGAFPQRNRLITGMSLGVIVVEAADRSGALISARHAMEQNREVFAVPGRVDSRASRGCHKLLRDGAKLVGSADDVLDELGPLIEPARKADGQIVHHPAELQLNDQELKVLAAIGVEPTTMDQVVATSGLPIHRVLSTISVLEMRRVVKRSSGNSVARV